MKRTFALVIFLSLFSCVVVLAQGRGRPPAEKKACPPRDDKLTLKSAVRVLNTPGLKECAIEYAKKYGVDFIGDQQILDVLDALNAPQELIDAIPLPPAPPKPHLSGQVTIAVEPRDSEVIINDHYYGKAPDGKTVIPSLPAGDATVRVLHDGFATETWAVRLAEDAPYSTSYSLIPTAERRREAARALLLQVVNAFGGTEGLAKIADASNSGTVTLLDEKQQAREWAMQFAGLWDAVNVSITSARNVCKTSKAGVLACNGKHGNSSEESLLNATLQRLREFQLPSVLGRLLTRSVTEKADSSGIIETDDGTDSYTLTVDREGLPVVLLYRPKSDSTPITVRYSAYLNQKGPRYPGRIEITDPPGEKPQTVFSIEKPPEEPAAPPKGK